MKLWPFGSSDDESTGVAHASRVVTGRAKDGATVRAKLTVHFESEVPKPEAEEQAELYASRLKSRFDEAAVGADLLGTEAELDAALGGPRASATAAVRTVEVVAIHLVGGPATVPPPPRRRSTPPPFAAVGRRSSSSSQMLAVRGEMLVQARSTPEAAGSALAPLLRDARTRVLIGVLRNYDVLVVRQLQVDEEMLDAMVPQSTAALGRFAESRAEELEKWHEALGGEVVGQLEHETAAVASHLLFRALEDAAVPTEIATKVLESAAAGAFTEGTAFDRMAAYLQAREAGPAAELARAVHTAVPESLDEDVFARVMAPVIASLHADFAFAASQVKLHVKG